MDAGKKKKFSLHMTQSPILSLPFSLDRFYSYVIAFTF